MRNDKKKIQGEPGFVLLSAPGKILIDVDVPEKEIIESIEELKNLI
jgi:3-dehydroquinate synthetase